jgi:hypothetical protein
MSNKYRYHDGQYSEVRTPNQSRHEAGAVGLGNRETQPFNDTSNKAARAASDSTSATSKVSQSGVSSMSQNK